jgi:hypothetical protein
MVKTLWRCMNVRTNPFEVLYWTRVQLAQLLVQEKPAVSIVYLGKSHVSEILAGGSDLEIKSSPLWEKQDSECQLVLHSFIYVTADVVPFIDVTADVVPLQVPLLLGLDIKTRYDMRVCARKRQLEGTGENCWSAPLNLEEGHLILPWSPMSMGIPFTKLEVVRMHRGFHHPSSKRLYDILRTVRPTEAPPHLLTTLEEISQRWDTCQRTARKPIHFRATIPRNLAFGEEIELDLMWIRGDSVLHATDVATGYSSAAWLQSGETAVKIWKTLNLCWTTFFPGFRRTIR